MAIVMPIEKMIYEVARCVKCGSTYSAGCRCWVVLKCPECGKAKMVERDATDPPQTHVVSAKCYQCSTGDFDETLYFGAHGEQLDVL